MNSQLWVNKDIPGIEFADNSYYTHRFKPHFHDHYVFVTVKQGINLGECQGKAYAVTTDDVLLVNPSEIHTGCSWQEQFLNYVALYISPSYFSSLPGGSADSGNQTTWFTHTMVHNKKKAGTLRALVENSRGEDSSLLSEKLFLFFTDMVRHFTSNPTSVPGKMYCRRFVKKGVAFIQQQYSEAVSIEKFCREENISYYSFIRSFKQFTGLTPAQYLINYRVEKAKTLLQQQEPLNSVCWDTGFFDQSHFNRHFKFITGMTPGQYSQCFR